MSKYAIVSGNLVVNVIEWDGVTPYDPAPNIIIPLPPNSQAEIGGTFNAGVFTRPTPTPPVQSPLELLVQTLVQKNVITAQEATAVISGTPVPIGPGLPDEPAIPLPPAVP